MTASQLMTEWIIIATEGETVDKRNIEAQWLVDMADSYDPELYTAMIWPAHDHSDETNAMGEVLALKSGLKDGLMRLWARLRPSIELIEENRNGNYLFSSIEPTPDLNFRGTGKPYLEGLGVTSTPASIGTQRLCFSAKKTTRIYGASEPLFFNRMANVEDFINMTEKTNTNEKRNLFFSIFGIKPKEDKSKGKKRNRFSIDGGNDGGAGKETDAGEVSNEEAITVIAGQLADALGEIDDLKAGLKVTQDVVSETADAVEEVLENPEFKKLLETLPETNKKFTELNKRFTREPSKAPGAKDGKKYAY